jgi:hypothetical protein
MACGCNKKKTSNRDIVNRGKKIVNKQSLPLVTVRNSSTKKK